MRHCCLLNSSFLADPNLCATAFLECALCSCPSTSLSPGFYSFVTIVRANGIHLKSNSRLHFIYVCMYLCIYAFKDFIIFFFLERGREGERGRKTMRETSVGCLWCAPYWGPGLQPRLCPDWELNGQPFGLQATTQYTELHQPGLLVAFYTSYIENTGWFSPIYVFSIISHWGVGISYFNIRDLFKVLG